MGRIPPLIIFLSTAIAIGTIAAGCSGSNAPATPTAVSPALATVAHRAGFPVEVPAYFPTSADELTQAHSEELTPEIVNLTYVSRETKTVGGTPRPSAVLFITESEGEAGSPTQGGAPLVSSDASGFELHGGPQKEPGVSAYIAIGNGHTINLVFQGERPTDDGVEKMLGSLKVVK